MTLADVYRAYLAIKLHFSSDKYDFFRFRGKTKTSRKAFDARHDLIHFRKLSTHYDPIGYLVSHLVINPRAWIGDIVRDDKPYRARRKVLDSLTRTFEKELKLIKADDIEARSNQHPGLLRLWLGNKISLETFVIILDLTGCATKWEKIYQDDPVMISVRRAIKYIPFLELFMEGQYDREKFRTIMNLGRPI